MALNGTINMADIKCKANRIRRIDRRICRNNCSQWKHRKCLRGYK